MKWRFVYLGERTPFETSMYPEMLITARTRGIIPDSMVIYRVDSPSVLISSRTNLRNVKTESCVKNKIIIARGLHYSRTPIYLDKKVLVGITIYKWEKARSMEDERFIFQKVLSEALNNMGLNSRPRKDGNDVLIGEKKVASVGHIPLGNLWLNAFVLFIDFDFDKAEQAIVPKHDMRRNMTTVKKELGRESSFKEVIDFLKSGFEKELQIEFEVVEDLTDSEYHIMEKLKEKYSSKSWLRYGRWSPVKDYWRSK